MSVQLLGGPRRHQPLLLARAQALRPLADYRDRIDLPATRFSAAFATLDAALPITAGGDFWADTALLTGDAGVALRVAAGSQVADIPLGAHAVVAPTLGAGLAGAARASAQFCAGQRFRLSATGDEVRVERRFDDSLRRGRREANDFALCMMLDLIRCAAGPEWRPRTLCIEGARPDHADELAALAESTHFDATADAVVLSRELLALPLPPRPSAELAATLPTGGFDETVRVAVRALLRLGELTLPTLAESAGMSARSFQRRLADAGLSFHRLADEARFEEAALLLRDPGTRVSDVAAEVGYADAANFTRAFRRWAGAPPSAFRVSGTG